MLSYDIAMTIMTFLFLSFRYMVGTSVIHGILLTGTIAGSYLFHGIGGITLSLHCLSF
jgi:hypothetical protein